MTPEPEREHATPICHFCGQPITGKRAVEAKTKNAWAHFSCWYDGSPVKDEDGEIV